MSLKIQFYNRIKALKSSNPQYLRNALKEVMQDYILNYIYNSDYNFLIFTGGTCLRKVYGLNRLSEDLDFDYTDYFDIKLFSEDIKYYYGSTLNVKLDTRLSTNQRTIYLKIPIEEFKSVFSINIGSDVLFLRCDFSKDTVGGYYTEVNVINTDRFSFFVKNYDLPTLFANKIVAFLDRVFYKGKFQKLPLKGRDVYDLFWFINLSSKSGFELKPNFKRLQLLTKEKDIVSILNQLKFKLSQIDPKYIYEDLYPLVESETYLKQFTDNYYSYINEKINYIFPKKKML